MGKIRRTKINLNEVETKPNKTGDKFDRCLAMFIDELDIKNLSYHTKRWYKENLTAFKTALEVLKLPTKPIDMNEKLIKQCILFWKREKQLSVTTINHRIRSLKQFFLFMNKEGIVDNFPFKDIDKLKGPKLIIKPFEEADLKKLFSQPDRLTFVGFRDYTMMLVFLDTGVRLIEMENMLMSNVCLSQNKILVFGKGAKEREVVFQAKTKEFLQKYMTIRGNLDHDFLWISDRNTPMTRRNIQERLSIYGKMAGLSHIRCSPHTFRHTCAKQYIKNGGDILSLQKLLGHSSLEMVRHYVNLWGSDLQEMHRRFSPVEGLFNSPKKT